jgi:hypothetical protein
VKIRFQADADLNQIILLAVIRREPTVEFHTASGAGIAGLADDEVLALAAREGRLLVTHDQSTMPEHFSTFIATSTSPGLLVVPQHLPPVTVPVAQVRG